MAAAKAEYEARAVSAPSSSGSAPAIDLDARLPGANSPISFDPLGAGKRAANASGTAASGAAPDSGNAPVQMKTWPADDAAEVLKTSSAGAMVIPVNSALEAVALSGFNARPSGSTTGAAGSVVSANQVGAPFVTRIKGEALLPNGWRLADLGDCSLGGSAIAVLSTERANVIANTLSCIGANGEVWEAPIEAYGLDVDGTLGIAGKVVSKQGSLLLQASLTAMASGLGNALSPTSVPSYNSSATNGSTSAVQYPNLPGLAQTLVGQGINQATAQLSKFYLDYAKEVFPVVEVTSGTRVTWVLTKSIELKRSGTGLAGAL
jgi:conjugal transfer pilus assembly protein TraB